MSIFSSAFLIPNILQLGNFTEVLKLEVYIRFIICDFHLSTGKRPFKIQASPILHY